MTISTFSQQALKIKEMLLGDAKRVVITSHHNPDGDAIGSVLGLYYILYNMGIKAKMISPNAFPDFLAWLPGSDDIILYTKKKNTANRVIQEADLIFALDYNGFARLEDMQEVVAKSKAKKILIDHHPYPENSFDEMLSEVNASSTAELVYELAVLVGGDKAVCLNAATCLFTGMMTDTGSFSYACSRPRTFEIVAKLIEEGVSIENAQHKVYNNFSESRMKLLGYSLCNKMKVFPDYNAAFISLTRKELKEYSYTIGDTEGLVNYPLSIKGIVFSALFVENGDFIKVSLRSRGDFPVNIVSQKYYSGGGHKNAAGGKSFSTLEKTESQFELVLQEFKQQLTQ